MKIIKWKLFSGLYGGDNRFILIMKSLVLSCVVCFVESCKWVEDKVNV